jgi:hypothetical protein
MHPQFVVSSSHLFITTHLTREITNTLPTFSDAFLPQADFSISTTDGEDVSGKRPADSPDCIGEVRVFGRSRGEERG